MIKSIGEMELSDANEMNIPVCVFLSAPEESETAWTLTANNYMPRRNYIKEGAFEYHADSKDELMLLINRYVIPLYETAIKSLKTNGKLYFWEVQND